MESKTFLNLIKEKQIQIPQIQRDYAQGRNNEKAKEIRESFLPALINALEKSGKPLILDFIYGSSKEGKFIPLDGQQRLTTLFLLHWYLCPKEELMLLQQEDVSKLTYETRISSKDFCKKLVFYPFQSAKDKFNSLKQSLEDKIQEINDKLKNAQEQEKQQLIQEKGHCETELKSWTLSKWMKNEPWFMWIWHKDPTVSAMLVMLDAIEKKLKFKTDGKLYTMWENLKSGQIVFHLLPLEQFNLTDELYVKMNARGKELSSFDIFKSTLEEEMRKNKVEEDVQNEWRKNVDSNWIDIFWNKLAKPKLEENIKEDEQLKCVESVEESYLRFLKRMMVFYLFANDKCVDVKEFQKENPNEIDYDKLNGALPSELELDEKDDIISKVREFSVRNDVLLLMPFFIKASFFRQMFFEFVILSFKSLIYSENSIKHDGTDLISNVNFGLNIDSLFLTFIDKNIDYDTRLQFYALLKFFEYNHAEFVAKNETLQNELNFWMRVVRNLTVNTNTFYYNTYKEFQNSLVEITKWTKDIYSEKKSETILDYLANKENTLAGFEGGQLKEEREKAVLMTNPDREQAQKWITAIKSIEEREYFLGQIRFLLEWSKEDNVENNLQAFSMYTQKICSVFDTNGLRDDLCNEHIFYNVMLVNDEWYLRESCFMYETGKNRDWSWKQYLREKNKSKNVKNLLDKWTNTETISFVDFCKQYIKENTPNDWRKCFIEKPEIYDQLYDKKVSYWDWGNREICLLSKTRWSSVHKELRTYYWHLKYKQQNDKDYNDSRNETHPFSSVFLRDASRKFSVKFIPYKGYVVSSNFNTQIDTMFLNSENNKWEQYFSSNEFQEVEKLLDEINIIFI
ncbi:MAG: DUF262 domain-containing protein [Firmicutes bacterium]|nr:DUF262 domain-containing protein [Bacillota bacterium]